MSVTPVKPRILCVDDEPRVLQGLGLHLRKKFDMTAAGSGAEALALLAAGKTFAVVVSDMRMPQMDGAQFLTQVRQVAPQTVRMLLTGHADMNAATAAINEGQIFRFLTKPCPPEQLISAMDAAVEQNRLLTAERDLLERTLHGSVRALTDVLSLTNPVAFGRSDRVKQQVTKICEALDLRDRWHIEVAAMLSQIGCVTLDPELAEKVYFGHDLTHDEAEQVRRLPDLTARLLGHIPRLEPVLELLSGRAKDLPGHVLKAAIDFDALESRGSNPQSAIDTLRARGHDPRVTDALSRLHGAQDVHETRELHIHQIRPGMVLLDEVRTGGGLLLAARGYEVTDSFVARAQTWSPTHVPKPIRVRLPHTQPIATRAAV
jgi:response regulator RpfG family c-di-GMP phosphodiesterase